jgi:hypothetical protein
MTTFVRINSCTPANKPQAKKYCPGDYAGMTATVTLPSGKVVHVSVRYFDWARGTVRRKAYKARRRKSHLQLLAAKRAMTGMGHGHYLRNPIRGHTSLIDDQLSNACSINAHTKGKEAEQNRESETKFALAAKTTLRKEGSCDTSHCTNQELALSIKRTTKSGFPNAGIVEGIIHEAKQNAMMKVQNTGHSTHGAEVKESRVAAVAFIDLTAQAHVAHGMHQHHDLAKAFAEAFFTIKWAGLNAYSHIWGHNSMHHDHKHDAAHEEGGRWHCAKKVLHAHHKMHNKIPPQHDHHGHLHHAHHIEPHHPGHLHVHSEDHYFSIFFRVFWRGAGYGDIRAVHLNKLNQRSREGEHHESTHHAGANITVEPQLLDVRKFHEFTDSCNQIAGQPDPSDRKTLHQIVTVATPVPPHE